MTLVEQYLNAGMEKEAANAAVLEAIRPGAGAKEVARQVAQRFIGKSSKGMPKALAQAEGNVVSGMTKRLKKGQTISRVSKNQAVSGGALGRADMKARTATGLGLGSLGAIGGVLGGAGLAAKKLMAKKTMGQKLIGALKANRKALAIGGGAAAGLGGLAAYKKAKG